MPILTTSSKTCVWLFFPDRETLLTISRDTLEITYHVNQVYLHEIALHADHDAEDFRPPFSITSRPSSKTRITPAYVNATLTCVSSSQSLLEFFLSMDPETVRALPTMAHARVVYCVVILMKLTISSSLPSNELSQILDPQDLRVDFYLTNIVVQFKAVTNLENDKKHILAGQFLNILTKLKVWYESLKGQQAPKNDQHLVINPNQEQKGRPATDTVAENATGLVPGGPTYGLVEDNFNFSLPPISNGPNFFTDISRDPNNPTDDSASTSSIPAQSWPNHNQSIFNYPETESLFPSSNVPFDFPMEVDPNMFTHLMDAELSQNGQGWQADSYINMPDFNWTNNSS